jgi:transposase-like protein
MKLTQCSMSITQPACHTCDSTHTIKNGKIDRVLGDYLYALSLEYYAPN